MAQYLLSVYMVEGEPIPPYDVIQTTYADVDRFNEEVKAAGAWVFGRGLHPAAAATVVKARQLTAGARRRPERGRGDLRAGLLRRNQPGPTRCRPPSTPSTATPRGGRHRLGPDPPALRPLVVLSPNTTPPSPW